MSKLLSPWQRVALAMFGIAWGGNEFTPLLVMYKQDGLSTAEVDVLLFAYVLGIVPALLLGGPLSDRYGRRALMLPAPFVSIAGSLVLAAGAGCFPLLFLGRVFSGAALGLAMAAGSSWIVELSAPAVGRAGAARRGAMSLTAGFALGAAAAGALAQWAPWPQHLAFLVNVAVTVPGAVLQFLIADKPGADRATGRLLDDLKVPAARKRRFLLVVLPVAPWVFGAAATAYAVLPALIAPKLQGGQIAFSALCCLVCLGCGFAAQFFAPKIDRPGTTRLGVVALALIATGMAAASVAASALTEPSVLVAALILGAGYGAALVAGLQEVSRIAEATDLAGLTAVFYTLTYLGFGVPVLLAVLTNAAPALDYPVLLRAGAVLALACLAVVARNTDGGNAPAP